MEFSVSTSTKYAVYSTGEIPDTNVRNTRAETGLLSNYMNVKILSSRRQSSFHLIHTCMWLYECRDTAELFLSSAYLPGRYSLFCLFSRYSNDFTGYLNT